MSHALHMKTTHLQPLTPIAAHRVCFLVKRVFTESEASMQFTNFQRNFSGHAATIELSPRQKLVRTNQICALRGSHSLSWSTITSQRV